MPVGTAVSAAGKLIQMPIMATSNPPTGVTIQKTTITGRSILLFQDDAKICRNEIIRCKK